MQGRKFRFRRQPRLIHSRPRFNFEHFLFRAKWNFFHLAFTIVAMAWAGAHAYEDVRAQLNGVVFANDAKEANRPSSMRQAPLRGAAPMPFLGTPFTKGDILKLRAAGLEEQLIIDVTKAFPVSFALDTKDIVELKRAGLTDALIRAMIQAQKRGTK